MSELNEAETADFVTIEAEQMLDDLVKLYRSARAEAEPDADVDSEHAALGAVGMGLEALAGQSVHMAFIVATLAVRRLAVVSDAR